MKTVKKYINLSARTGLQDISSLHPNKMKQIYRKFHWIIELLAITITILCISYLFFNSLFLSLLCSASALFFKNYIVSQSKIKYQKIVECEFKTFILTLSSILSIGRSLESSIILAIEELEKEGTIYLLNDDFKDMIIQIEANRYSSEIFENLSYKYSIESMNNFCHVINLAKKQGSSMQKVINNTVQMIEEKIEVEKELEVVTAQKKFELIIMLFFVPMMIMYLRLVSPNFSETMYQTAQGRISMIACLVIYGISGYIGSKIIDIKI